uniref:Uncharacterized protein n=1 Tax=Sphenodon punctatus TaxID=8508 RepID=A0A8D0GL74_SPHPU
QQEQLRALLSRHHSTLESAASKLRSCLQEREEARRRAEEALRAKAAADLVLDAVRAHSSTRIGQLEQDAESQRKLCARLEEARLHQVDLSREQTTCLQQGDRLSAAMREDWTQMQRDYTAWRDVLTRHHPLVKMMFEEAKAARQDREEHRTLSQRLAKVTAELQDAEIQVEKLSVANSRLGAGMSLWGEAG